MNKCKSALSLLSSLVSVDTVNSPAEGKLVGIKEARVISSILEEHGFSHNVDEHAPVPILYDIRGEGRPVTLWLAHYDVVPPGPGWTRDPFKLTIEDGKAYGRGATDDKGNVTALAEALASYEPKQGTIIIAFTGDEEIGGKSAEYLAEKLGEIGLFPDYMVNADGALSKVIIRRRGGFGARIRVKSRKELVKGRVRERTFETMILLRETMHSAYFIPGVDTHALVAASLWIRDNNILVSSLSGEWVKSNVIPRKTTISYVETGGDKLVEIDTALTQLLKSIVPLVRAPIPTEKYSDYGVSINPNYYTFKEDYHELVLDIRAMTTDKDKIQEILEEILENNLDNEYTLTVTGGKGYLYTDKDSLLVRKASETNKLLGLDPEPIEAGGASDSRYFSPKGVESIDYGPLGGNIHGPDEYVSIEHLCKTIEFYSRLARELHG
ncbi:MAG: M20/M25/M40 family metallo-hydrolase [Desulfurococcales archaeon]|nr:M20/M25/M40 family metallo-hydrolase [Desulfurococcales archaeon]